MDAVESYQELLRSGYMEPASRDAVKNAQTSSMRRSGEVLTGCALPSFLPSFLLGLLDLIILPRVLIFGARMLLMLLRVVLRVVISR